MTKGKIGHVMLGLPHVLAVGVHSPKPGHLEVTLHVDPGPRGLRWLVRRVRHWTLRPRALALLDSLTAVGVHANVVMR